MGFFNRFFSSKPPSKDTFAEAVLDGVKRAGEQREVVYDKDQFQLRTQNVGFFNLGNVYPEYCAVPKARRPEVVKKVVRVWFAHQKEIPSDFEDVRADLLPIVHARSYYELVSLQLQLKGHKEAACPHHIFGDHFAVGLVYDLPDAMKHVTQAELDKWGVTLYEALETARQNLAQVECAFLGPRAGIGLWAAMQKDSYDAARILLLDVIRRFPVGGDVVAMIPNRERLLFAGADDVDALRGMLTMATDAIQHPRRISGIALRLDGDEWVPWLPATDHPLYSQFRNLQTQSLGQDYAEQKELLDKLHQKTGEDIFVASFSGMSQKGSDEITSYCVWSKGVLAWLPHTDRVALLDPGGAAVVAEWDKVAEEVGDLMQPLDMYPTRYKVCEFPSEKQLAAIGGEKVSR